MLHLKCHQSKVITTSVGGVRIGKEQTALELHILLYQLIKARPSEIEALLQQSATGTILHGATEEAWLWLGFHCK